MYITSSHWFCFVMNIQYWRCTFLFLHTLMIVNCIDACNGQQSDSLPLYNTFLTFAVLSCILSRSVCGCEPLFKQLLILNNKQSHSDGLFEQVPFINYWFYVVYIFVLIYLPSLNCRHMDMF
jgi:hypothetical protein